MFPIGKRKEVKDYLNESRLSWYAQKLCHRCHHLIAECEIASDGATCKEVIELARKILERQERG